MNTPGLPSRTAPGMFRLIRFIAGSLVILILLSVYCLNVSHRWKEGLGALPNEHVNWLPASAFQSGSVESLGMAVVLLVVCGLMMNLRSKQVEILLTVMTAMGAVTSLVTIGQRLSPRPFAVFDLTGFFPYENHFAAFANLLFPVALCLGERWRIRAFQNGKVSSPAGLFFCAAGLMIAAVALSGSRAGLLIACLISGAWLLLQVRLYRRYPQIVLSQTRRVLQEALVHRHELFDGCSYRLPVFGKRSLCVAPRKRFLNTGKRWLHHLTQHLIRDGVLVAAALILIPALIYLVNQLRQVGEELSFRGKVLADTVAMGFDNPFWGSGPGSFSAVFPYYQSLPVDDYFFRHAHCEPLQFFAEYGLLGCLVLAAGAALILFSRRRRPADSAAGPSFWELEGAGLGLALAGVMLHSWVDFPLRHPLIALLTVVWIGILSGTVRGKRNAKKPKIWKQKAPSKPEPRKNLNAETQGRRGF